MHIQVKHTRRAVGDLLGASSAAGIGDNTIVASGHAATATGLVVDNDVTATVSVSLPLVATTQAPATVGSTVADVTITPPASKSAQATQQPVSSSSSDRRLGPILGLTVGCIAAVALVLLTILFYIRRSSRTLKSRGRGVRTRNLQGEQGRRRSRLEPWARLDSGEDKGHGGEWSAAGEMEKMDDMFKGGADSVRSGTTTGARTDLSTTEAPQLPEMTRYHAGLAEELAGAAAEPAFPQRAYAPRSQAQDVPMSWGAETTGGDSFLTLRSARMSGAMSPTLGFAKQTPVVSQSPISDEHHQWQSAVVVLPSEGEVGIIEDPFANPVNPFADVQDGRSRAFVSHKPSASAFSDTSSAPSEHAMQSLIAALDLTPSAPMRTASMSPSDISAYSDAGQIVRDFPLPPPVVAGGDAQTLVRG